MKWGVFFVKKSGKVENGDLISSTQGALCKISVFPILHFTYTHPRTPLPTGLLLYA